MIHCVHPRSGVVGAPGDGSRSRFSAEVLGRGENGFTLIEMCIVLFIIALLVGLTVPAMETAFTEQHVRQDTHQLALMVKTGMIQSAEQHRAYALDLTPTSMALHPVGEATADPTAISANDSDNADTDDAGPKDVEVTNELDPPNKLLGPDPDKVDAWVPIPPTTWIFQSGELCPATRVRLARGDAWLEMSFDALTGNVENEKDYMP
jgi:prepilin-type N-terminal cleavage/methylation domain-containing protein